MSEGDLLGGGVMSGRHGAAPRLVQRGARGRSREQRAGRFVVVGPASDGVVSTIAAGGDEPYHAAVSPGRVEHTGGTATAYGASGSGSRRRAAAPPPAVAAPAPTAHPLDHGEGIDTDRFVRGEAIARYHEQPWPGSSSNATSGPGSLVWGSRIDERLDRLERLVEVATERSERAEEQVAAVLRRCSDQREELEELRFEFRRKPPDVPGLPAPPEPQQSHAAAAANDALAVQELTVRVQALQQHCDALVPRMDEMQAKFGLSQRQDIADKVARAMSKESKRIRVELSSMRDEVNSTSQQTQRLGRETDGSITAVKRRMDEWELSTSKTEQTLMAELHELSRTSAEAVKRLSTVESDYQIFLMKMERHERSAQEMDEHFADFSLAKEEIDQGIESLAKQQKEFQVERIKTDAALAHLQEDTGLLHATTTAFRGELDEASRRATEREAETKRLLENLGDRGTQQLEQSIEAQDEARVALEERIQQLVRTTADELLEKAQAEDAACSEALRGALDQFLAKLQGGIDEMGASAESSLAAAQAKIEADMQQLRADDVSLRNDTEQIARELALKMQQTFQDLGRRSDQMAEQLARNMEGMGDELAANTNKALQELTARMTETEVEGEMSKLVIRAAVERNREGIEDLRSETSARCQAVQGHVDKLQQAQSDNLAHAIQAMEEQLTSAQAEGREELAASIAKSEESLRNEAIERKDHVGSVKATLSKHIKSLGQKAGQKIVALQAETTDRMDQQHRDIVRLIETLHTAVSHELVSHQQDTAQMERDIEQRFAEVQAETATVLQSLRSDAVQAEVELRQEVDHRFKETELAQAHANMISRLVDQSTTKSMVDDLHTAIIAAEARCGDRLELVSTEIQKKVVCVHDRLEEVDLHHCAQGLTLRAVVESELERAAADRRDLHTRADVLQQSLTDGFLDISSKLVAEKQALVHRIDSSSRALHLFQKLMGRVDSADIFTDEIRPKEDGQIDIAEVQSGFRKMGEHLSDADARAFIVVAAGSEAGSINPAVFTQVSRLAKQADKLSSRLTDGLSSCKERLDAEVSALSASINSAVAQLKSDATVMLEQRILPCEQSITKLREDTTTMLEQRIKPCETMVSGLRNDQDSAQNTIGSNCLKLEQLAAKAEDLNQQFQWTSAVLEEESERREAVEEAVGAVWLKVGESLKSMQSELGATIVEKIEPCVLFAMACTATCRLRSAILELQSQDSQLHVL